MSHSEPESHEEYSSLLATTVARETWPPPGLRFLRQRHDVLATVEALRGQPPKVVREVLTLVFLPFRLPAECAGQNQLIGAEIDLVPALQSEKKLVDVTCIEPVMANRFAKQNESSAHVTQAKVL
jgi:hypothetical protein